MQPAPKLSKTLQDMAKVDQPLSLKSVNDNFAENGFAVLCLLLMAIPALPLPTGGITHIFEIIVMLLAIEMIAGRRSIWLPSKWLNRQLPGKFKVSTLPALAKFAGKIEKYSRPRLVRLMSTAYFSRIIGILILIFTLFAFLAPPFSGLDTLPSLGVVLICLAVLLNDAIVAILGLLAGAAGIALIFTLGSLVFKLL